MDSHGAGVRAAHAGGSLDEAFRQGDADFRVSLGRCADFVDKRGLVVGCEKQGLPPRTGVRPEVVQEIIGERCSLKFSLNWFEAIPGSKLLAGGLQHHHQKW